MKKLLLLIVCFWPLSAFATKDKLDPIKHIIVIFLENHSFDNLFGTFPGANGLKYLEFAQTQEDGRPYATLPPVISHNKADKRFPPNDYFPDGLPNSPFPITDCFPAKICPAYNDPVPDPLHRFYQTQQQINGGKMDKFVQYTNVGALVMGYYEAKDKPLWQYAKKYTLADNFFTAAFGGSLLNHFWLVCGCTPHYKNAPDSVKVKLDEKGMLIKDGPVTPDGYVVNNIQPFTTPYDPQKAPKPEMRMPLSDLPTIGERLSEKGISWAWYNGGWDDAVNGKLASFIPHHHPFLYFKAYDVGTEARAKHLKDEKDFLAALKEGNLPAVSFYKPIGKFDLHPTYSALEEAEAHVFSIVKKIEQSSIWKDSLVIVTFDDSGGFYDHVAPPKRDRYGPGIRIPTLIISPFARKGYVDSTQYDTTSVLKLIEDKFGLRPLNDAYKNAGDLRNALQ